MPEGDPSDPVHPGIIRVQFMGRPSDVFGSERILTVETESATLGAIRQRLAESLEDGAGDMLLDPAIRGGVEDAIAPDSARALPGQTVFFFSIVSGG